MPKPRKKTPPGGKSRLRPPTTDLLDQFSPYRVADILPTSTVKKEDTFESYVPKDGVCLDYNVSQTFLRMDAGTAKICIKDTIATYVPIPQEMIEAQLKKAKQRSKSSKFGHGYPPQYVFVDEIWAQKQNELQEMYKQNLLKFVKARKKRDKLEGKSTHKRVQSMVGPDWYQELSPNQIRTADELKFCILKDMRDGTIINTQENIGSLGLVLRPNHHHIALALRLCCKCPIEFLLTLYQLINPERSEYSLNDRLLLSAVVHLAMTDTLHEMHVRIPSPPRPEKVPPKPPKKPKPKTYISPYLKPYDFEPEKRKHSGIYENKHIQLPESPYFSYRENLIFERLLADDVIEMDNSYFDPEEQDLVEDWRQAQLIYDELQNDKKVKLIKPTILTGCSDFDIYCEEMLAKLDEKGDGEGGKGNSKAVGDVTSKSMGGDLDVGGQAAGGKTSSTGGRNDIAGDRRASAGDRRASAGDRRASAGDRRASSGDRRASGDGRRGSLGSRRGSSRDRGDEEPELVLPPLAKLEDDDPNEICDCHPDAGICREHQSVKPCAECKKRDTSTKCTCKKRAKLLKGYKQKITKIIGGVVMTSDNIAVPIISGIYPPRCCDLPTHWVDTLAVVEKKCGYCQMFMDTIICSEHQSLQPCEYCRRFTNACNCRDRSLLLKEYKRHTKRMIGGVVLTKSNTAVPIISGISPPRNGDWVQVLEDIERKCRYCEKIKDLEKCCEHQLPEPCEECQWQCMKACECREQSKLYTTPKCRLCATREFKKNTQKWIGGITLTRSETAIPIISGLVPPKICDCVQDYKNKILAAAARNKIQCHKATFIIGGLTITKDGPVYNLTAALKKKKRITMPKRVCKSIKEKSEDKEKRELGPYDCNCGRDISEEETEEELDCKAECRYGDSPEVCAPKKKKPKKKAVCIREESDDEDEETCSCKKDKKDSNEPKAPHLCEYCTRCANACNCRERAYLLKEYTRHSQRIIGGVTFTESNTAIPIISGIAPPRDGDWLLALEYIERKCGYCHKINQRANPEESPCDCKDVCDCNEASKLITDNKCDMCLAKRKQNMVQRIIGGVQIIDGDTVPIVQGTRFQDSCECLQEYKDKIVSLAARKRIMDEKPKFVVVGVTSTQEGPVYILSSAVGEKKKKKKRRKKVEDQDDCVCKKSRTKKQKKDSNNETDNSPFNYSCCRCREELDTFLSHKCTCEKCMELENQRNATYIKSGVKYTESGNVIDILSGVYGQTCNCLEKYLEKLAALEDYRKRIEARYRLKSQNVKYAIGGVVNGPNGPVYIISGMRPPVECECARVLQQKLEEQEQQSRMPKMPPTGRIKYAISGVKQMSNENVFIVNQAVAIDDCDCMKLYNKFEDAHKGCLDTYDEFLKQVQTAIDEYENELSGPRRSLGETMLGDSGEFAQDEQADDGDEPVRQSVAEENGMEPEEEGFDTSKEASTDDEISKEATTVNETSEESSTEEYTESTESEISSDSSTASIPAMELKFTPSGRIDTSLESETEADETQPAQAQGRKASLRKEEQAQGRRASLRKDEQAQGRKASIGSSKAKEENKKSEEKGENKRGKKKGEEKKKEEKKKEVVDKNQDLKRFLILQKIPCEEHQQIQIVKRVLDTLAEDGYPLAKLPDCHMLPHFKLWMQMRCGMFWTQKDRVHYELFSKVHWCHTDRCHREVKRPQLGINKRKAALMTWKDATFIRNIVKDRVGMYYRLVRQENIETVREFFPLTFSYEFPTPMFRHYFFAYLPSKEEDVLVYRIVKPHEARVNLKKFPCY